MKDERKTKAQLIEELEQLREQVARLERHHGGHRCEGEDHLYREMVEHANDIIYTISPEGVLTYVSPNWTEILGHDTDEVVGSSFTPFVHTDDLDRCLAFLKSVFASGERQGPIEYRVKHKDGEYRCHTSNAALLDAPDGSMVYVGIARDVTERKAAEEALQRANDDLERRVAERTTRIEASERMFRGLTESIGAMVFIVGIQDPGVIYANPAAIDGLGYSMEELKDATPPKLLAPESLEQVLAAREAFMRGGEVPSTMELQFITKSGEARWYETTVALVNTEQGLAKVTVSFDVTDRRLAQEALQESERKFRALADGTPAGIAITQGDRFTYANKAVMERSGMSWEELSAMSPHDMLSQPAHEAGHQALMEAMGEGADQWSFEFLDPDGAWYEVSASSIELEGKDATIWTSFDITDRKKALEAMEESERRFRGLAETSAAHITIICGDRYIYANRSFLDYQGMDDLEELQLISPEDLMMGAVGPGALEAADPAYEAAMARGENHFTFEYEDMEGTWFQTTVTIMELDGSPAYMTTTFDITGHKRAQERYRTIFDTAGTGMISFGEDSVITLANEEWTKLTGYSIDETVGELTWQQLFTEESLTKMREYHELRSKDPAAAPRAYEAQLVDRAGTVHDGIVNIQVVPGTQLRVASFQDLTELKRAQQQMIRADKMAALGQIIAGVAHEINNPNNFIYFNLPILRRYIEAMRPLLERALAEEPDLTLLNMPYEQFLQDVFGLLENMEHGSERITAIVSDLKTYIRSGEDAEMKREPLEPIIDQVMALIGKQVRKQVRCFETEVQGPLPRVRVNPGKLEQVLINLVINAGQAADKDDSMIRLMARPVDDGAAVAITVEDNGAGIPAEIKDQIFEPFFTSKGREEGTGLGLSISHQIIQDHGGTLEVSSEVGQGTRFTVRLPAAAQE